MSGGWRTRLAAAYAEPHRAYHTLAHIEDCLRRLASIALDERSRRALEIAIWWHDAIYDPRAGDNEERSAAAARAALEEEGEPADLVQDVARLILLTKGHTASAEDRLGSLMVSIDLAILGAGEGDYDAYAAAIRREYAHVPETLYRAGRAQVLRRFLEARPLFADPAFEAALGHAARANLTRELAALTSASDG